MLQESAECEADLILVACVRFQLIADSLYRALPSRLSQLDGRNAPIWMHTSQLQKDLQNIFNGLSSDVQNHGQQVHLPIYTCLTRFLSYYKVELPHRRNLSYGRCNTGDRERINIQFAAHRSEVEFSDGE